MYTIQNNLDLKEQEYR